MVERPRVLYPVNILEWLLRDRNAPFNQILYRNEICEIFTYWGHNDWEFSCHVFDWAYRKIAEEFKSSFEYGPYLRIIGSLMSDENDRYYNDKCATWLPKLATMARRCSKTNEKGTDLLMYALISWFSSMTLKHGKFGEHLRKDNGFLGEIMRNYEQNHGTTYEIVKSNGQKNGDKRVKKNFR